MHLSPLRDGFGCDGRAARRQMPERGARGRRAGLFLPERRAESRNRAVFTRAT
ncbi:hypothetical protein Ga0080574_TMP1168 [Salipiger abyssi]|uniref:Uncharacterized protein n=1 Tax=Salipiger abyssi TaxID=1250539 RepID=A0A1P8UQ28_9RHOB|nr:hypothetical protein Ga0080574_TMP1168 [Salipiger abyssi]